MDWLIAAASLCVVGIGFLTGAIKCCCTKCHKLCLSPTDPTGSITVTLPSMTENAYGCGGCAGLSGGVFILDRIADPFAFYNSTGCLPTQFLDSCWWGLDISPKNCSTPSRETMLVGLNGDDGGVRYFGATLKLCWHTGLPGGHSIQWGGSFTPWLPINCATSLGTRTLTFLGSDVGFCDTTGDATVEF